MEEWKEREREEGERVEVLLLGRDGWMEGRMEGEGGSEGGGTVGREGGKEGGRGREEWRVVGREEGERVEGL